MNMLDSIIENDNNNDKKLMNGIRDSELKFGFRKDQSKNKTKSSNPTPVTLVSVRGGKKDRTITLNGLRVLIDSGSLHYVATTKCAKENKHKWTTHNREFTTATGVLATQYESKIKFNLSEFSESNIIEWKFSLVEAED